MALNAIHDSLDDIPEQFQELYTEKNGKYELTGISGVKTQADVDRLQVALGKERDEHKASKERSAVWADLDYEDVMKSLDRIPELEAAAGGKLDEAEIENIVSRRVDGTLSSKLAPVERQLSAAQAELAEALQVRDALLGEKRTRAIHDDVRAALTKAKVIPEAHEDALMLAERLFEVREDDGAVVTRDNVGVTPGVQADVWLSDIQTSRPHWWGTSQGGGAAGSRGAGGGGFAQNPWSGDSWNMTEQGRVVNEKGMEKAQQMARAAGTTVGGARPKAKS